MSTQFKKAGRIGTKIVAAFLFLFLLMFNVEVGLYDVETSESGILGFAMSVFVQDAVAGGGSDPEDCDANCEDCSNNGYQNWNYWLSGVDGKDCWCNDRRKVWNPCS